MNQAVIGRLKRQGYGLLIYRSILTFAFLIAAFSAFPHLKPVIGLAVLLFNQAIAALGHVATAHFHLANMLDDEAERKTRHAILLAAESPRRDAFDQFDFWPEVNRRVDAERGEPVKDVGGWSGAGLTAWNTLSRAFGDVLLIAVAALLTPTY